MFRQPLLPSSEWLSTRCCWCRQ